MLVNDKFYFICLVSYLQLPDVCLSSLQKLSVLLFHCYPLLPSHTRYQGSVSLLKLIMAVSSIPTSFKQFLSHIGTCT